MKPLIHVYRGIKDVEYEFPWGETGSEHVMTVTLHEGERNDIGEDWCLQVLGSVNKNKRFIDVGLGDAGIHVEGWWEDLDIVWDGSKNFF